MFTSRRINVFIGGFGSGKTEISINLALEMARGGRRVSLADLDIVTPYFRSREARSWLECEGVGVIAPGPGLAAADLPVLPPELQGAVADSELYLILDVGGDDLGARALGTLNRVLPGEGVEAFLVVNPRRPFSGSPEGVAELLEKLEGVARLKVTGLVANPHLGTMTTLPVIQSGLESVGVAAARVGLPIRFVCARRDLAETLGPELDGIPVLPLDLYMVLPWDEWPRPLAGRGRIISRTEG